LSKFACTSVQFDLDILRNKSVCSIFHVLDVPAAFLRFDTDQFYERDAVAAQVSLSLSNITLE